MRRLSGEEIAKEYKDIFVRCYGEWDDTQLPELVLVEEHRGIVVYFFSGYLRDKNEIYIQYQGVIPTLRDKGLGYEGVKKLLEWCAKNLQVKFLSCLIENTNVPEMILLIKNGFLPYGSQVSRKGTVLIHWGVDIEAVRRNNVNI